MTPTRQENNWEERFDKMWKQNPLTSFTLGEKTKAFISQEKQESYKRGLEKGMRSLWIIGNKLAPYKCGNHKKLQKDIERKYANLIAEIQTPPEEGSK